MIGLWLALLGMIFGALSSYTAKQKNRLPENWFVLGLIFLFVPLIVLYFIPDAAKERESEDYPAFGVKNRYGVTA